MQLHFNSSMAQYAASSSVVVFLTASDFLRQKTDEVKTKGAAVFFFIDIGILVDSLDAVHGRGDPGQ